MTTSTNASVLEQLNSKEAQVLHETINELSRCGVGRLVNLPQIVVVGQQSSGKSSVLEAITHIRFPIQYGVCTRFATEFILRHAPHKAVRASVEFADKSKQARHLVWTGDIEDDLAEVIDHAKEAMGVSAAGKTFSKDVLRLEIDGPDMYPLTLVDLPGLYTNATEDQSREGVKIVEEVVESYIKNKNSIILVVLPADVELALQVALTKVTQADPERARTLGVITKPDRTQRGMPDEVEYIRLARNQEARHKLLQGWHVLRNRAANEPDLDARDRKEEQFFVETAWSTLPSKDRGVISLRTKLSRILYNHVRQNIHDVIKDINAGLNTRQLELTQLGGERSAPGVMRDFLIRIASEFQRIARDGIEGRYNDPFFGNLDDHSCKLRAQIRNSNRIFSHVLKVKGSKEVYVEADGRDLPRLLHLGGWFEHTLQRYSEICPPQTYVSTEALAWRLRRQAVINQGRQFPGSSNHELIFKLFREQASSWEGIARYHIEFVSHIAKAFVDRLFDHVIRQPDRNTTEIILRTVVDDFFTSKQALLEEKLQELLRPYNKGFATFNDDEFHEALATRSVVQQASHDGASANPGLNSSTRGSSYANSPGPDDSNDLGSRMDQTIKTMQVYYEMSLRVFTDNIANLALESCLIWDLPGILSPDKVNAMNDEQLVELAAESQETRDLRVQLQEEISNLRTGLNKCRGLAPRPNTSEAFPDTLAAAKVRSNDSESDNSTEDMDSQDDLTKGSLSVPIISPSPSDTVATPAPRRRVKVNLGPRATAPSRDAISRPVTPSASSNISTPKAMNADGSDGVTSSSTPSSRPASDAPDISRTGSAQVATPTNITSSGTAPTPSSSALPIGFSVPASIKAPSSTASNSAFSSTAASASLSAPGSGQSTFGTPSKPGLFGSGEFNPQLGPNSIAFGSPSAGPSLFGARSAGGSGSQSSGLFGGASSQAANPSGSLFGAASKQAVSPSPSSFTSASPLNSSTPGQKASGSVRPPVPVTR